MDILNAAALDKFARKHRDANLWLLQWRETVQQANWQNINDVRKLFPSAYGVPVSAKGGSKVIVTVFNVKGNEYRLLTLIAYKRQLVSVLEVLTHEEYDTDRWKQRI